MDFTLKDLNISNVIINIIFLICAVTAILLSLMVIIKKNPLYCALSLAGSFVPVAVIYFLLYASFVGIIQILVYAGAIMVLFTFVIMLIDLSSDEYSPQKPLSFRIISGLGTALFISLFLIYFIFDKIFNDIFISGLGIAAHEGLKLGRYAYPPDHLGDFGTAQKLGDAMFSKALSANYYLFSFELISMLILLAIVGAIILAKRRL